MAKFADLAVPDLVRYSLKAINLDKPKRKKAASAASSDSEPRVDNQDVQDNPASATITVSVVEVPELTDQEQSDKPDGMATLTACTWSRKLRERFLRRERLCSNCAIADYIVPPTVLLKNTAAFALGVGEAIALVTADDNLTF